MEHKGKLSLETASTCLQCHPLPCNRSHPIFLGANRCHQRPSLDICDRPPCCPNHLYQTVSLPAQKGYFIVRSRSKLQGLWTVRRMFQSFSLPLCQKVSHRSCNVAAYIVLQHVWHTSNKMHLHHTIGCRCLQENFSITLNSQFITLRS
jgi:hypothetical protein